MKCAHCNDTFQREPPFATRVQDGKPACVLCRNSRYICVYEVKERTRAANNDRR